MKVGSDGSGLETKDYRNICNYREIFIYIQRSPYIPELLLFAQSLQLKVLLLFTHMKWSQLI